MKKIKLVRTVRPMPQTVDTPTTNAINYPQTVTDYLNLPEGARILARTSDEVIFEVKGVVIKGYLDESNHPRLDIVK